MTSILDRTFRYVNSVQTDVRRHAPGLAEENERRRQERMNAQAQPQQPQKEQRT